MGIKNVKVLARISVLGVIAQSACGSGSISATDGQIGDFQITDSQTTDLRTGDDQRPDLLDLDGNAVGDISADSADASDPLSYFVSPNLVTDSARREFASIADFKALGPTCMGGGEKITFQSGQRFHGSLTLKNCNGATGSVTVSTYGGAQRATITGTRSISELGLSWTIVTNPTFNGKAITYLQGTPLYRAGPITKEVQQLYYKGVRMSLARHPSELSSGSAASQYFSAAAFWEYSPTGCQATTCVMGEASENGVGPLRTYGLGPDTFAVIRTSNWTLQRSKVTWVSSDPANNGFAVADSLRTAANGNRLPTAGYGFVLLNTLPLLDHTSEWVWDRNDQYLYFWTPDNLAPLDASTMINFTSDEALISANFGGAALNLIVTDLVVEQAPHTAVKLLNGRHLTVERVHAIQPEVQGIYALNLSGNVRVADCEIEEPGNNGITAYNMESAEIVDNLVTEPGPIHNQPSLIMNFNGIRVGGNVSTVALERNTVKNAGYAGVMLGPATSSLTVANNKVDGYCELLNDCGGIYYNGMNNTLKTNQFVSGNTFSGSLGNTNGIPSGLKLPIAVGVYLDHGTSDFVLRKNTITGSHSTAGGIFLHGGNNNLVDDNTVLATHGPAFGMRKIEPDFSSMSGNNVTNNNFTTSSAEYAVIRFIDPSGNNCAGMFSVLAASNTLTHTVNPTFLQMCQ